MRKKKINFSSKRKRNNLNVKRCALIAIAAVLVIVVGFKGVNATTAFIEEKRQERIEMQKKAEAERLEEERKRKEEEEAKKKMVGVTHEGKKYTYDAKKIEEKLAKYDYSNDGKKMVFLTFDDGSSTTVTPEILKILKENDVRATFFVTGENIERGGQKAEDLIKESFEYGNAIANHSYTHNYKYLYPGRTLNLDNFLADFNKTDELLKKILGPYFSTRVIRCPGGHMSWKGMDQLDNYLNENNMASIDWNALNADAEGRKKNAQELADYAIKTSQGKDIVILAIGSMVKNALEAREILLEEGINPTIVNARFLKPIDKELLDRLFKDHKKVVTIEDNVITGGFSTNINKFIIDNKYDIDIINIALPEEFIPHGSVDEIYNSVGLSPIKIAEKIKSL